MPYLTFQIDIECAEVAVLNDLVQSDLLLNVQQIGVEFHNVSGPTNLNVFFDLTWQLHLAGFQIISFDPNYEIGQQNGFFKTFEIVFRKFVFSCE